MKHKNSAKTLFEKLRAKGATPKQSEAKRKRADLEYSLFSVPEGLEQEIGKKFGAQFWGKGWICYELAKEEKALKEENLEFRVWVLAGEYIFANDARMAQHAPFLVGQAVAWCQGQYEVEISSVWALRLVKLLKKQGVSDEELVKQYALCENTIDEWEPDNDSSGNGSQQLSPVMWELFTIVGEAQCSVDNDFRKQQAKQEKEKGFYTGGSRYSFEGLMIIGYKYEERDAENEEEDEDEDEDDGGSDCVEYAQFKGRKYGMESSQFLLALDDVRVEDPDEFADYVESLGEFNFEGLPLHLFLLAHSNFGAARLIHGKVKAAAENYEAIRHFDLEHLPNFSEHWEYDDRKEMDYYAIFQSVAHFGFEYCLKTKQFAEARLMIKLLLRDIDGGQREAFSSEEEDEEGESYLMRLEKAEKAVAAMGAKKSGVLCAAGCGKQSRASCLCKSIRYCSDSCQKSHWKVHKAKCTYKKK